MGSVRREVWAGIGGAAAMAALTAVWRQKGAPTTEPQPKTGAPWKDDTAKGASASSTSGSADYQSVVNVAAGVVTLSAGVLGVYGITGGVAVALLRNAPAAVTTASLAAGTAVLLGVASAFISPKRTGRDRPRTTRIITGLIAVLVGAALGTTGLAFTSRAVPTVMQQVLWWVFLGLIGVLVLGGAIVVAFKGRRYRLKTLAILASLAVFGVSVLCVVVLAAGETRTSSRPAVSVNLEFKAAATSADSATATSRATPAPTLPGGSFVLHVTLKSLGMTSDERYLVVVDRLSKSRYFARELYRTYVGPDAGGNVQYAFSIPVAVDNVNPWLGVAAGLQRVGERRRGRSDHCGLEKNGGSHASGSTCAIVYADPTLPSS